VTYSADDQDLWSVGIITYEMVVGELPYKGNNISQLLHNISHQSLVFPPDIGLSEEIKCVSLPFLLVLQRINLTLFFFRGCTRFRHLLSGLLQKDADLRLGWNEFFAHRCLQPDVSPRASTRSSASTASAGAQKQIAQLEAELQAKEQEILKLKETMAQWDEEKANQFNKIKEMFERENNELRSALETQRKEGKEREELLVTQMNEMKKLHIAEMAAYKDMLSTKVLPAPRPKRATWARLTQFETICRNKRTSS
jgi:serine/threonine protein kinase